jgi:hypothetical protein
VVISGLFRRLCGARQQLASLTEYWTNKTLTQIEHWPDAGLVREGLHLFAELPRNTTREFLLATDLHAGNVLRAEREPWLLEQRSIVGHARVRRQVGPQSFGRFCPDPIAILYNN